MAGTMNPESSSAIAVPISPLEEYRQGFIDTGIYAEFSIPFLVNRFKMATNNPLPNYNLEQLNACTTRAPLFGIMVDPFQSHDLSGVWSSAIYADPHWVTNNTDISLRATGYEHPLTRMAATFAGWSGSLEFLFDITSTAITQGSLSFVKGRYGIQRNYSWRNPPLELDEPSNNSIINLAQERRIMLTANYDETSDFIHMPHYWQNRTQTPELIDKPMNYYRNFIFVRPITDITTLSPNGGSIMIKIYMKPGPDFSWRFPSAPVNFSYLKMLSNFDKRNPFQIKHTIVVKTRLHPSAGDPNFSGSVCTLEDSYTQTTFPVTVAKTISHTPPPAQVSYRRAWFDARKYSDIGSWYLSPRWNELVTYDLVPDTGRFDIYVTDANNIRNKVASSVDAATIPVGTVLFEWYESLNPDANWVPPYWDD